MTTMLIFKFVVVSFAISCVSSKKAKRPNIIVIVADDLGWNDVGFHGSNQIPTPNIDALAYSGIILNNYYVNPICTPSRSALMTGLHPIHTGMQSNVIIGGEPHGVPLKFKFMPQLLADNLGYRAHAVGKWHLGYHRKVYLPTNRGFLSHYGYWNGMQDYYDHTYMNNKDGWGYDLRRNLSVAWDDYGRYATDLFTDEAVAIINDHGEHHSNSPTSPLFLYLAHLAVHSANFYAPLQAPKDVVDKFKYIEDDNRRKFAGMLYKLDESVGRVTKALQENDMLKNSIIVFTTDNGGPAAGFDRNHASNWPLKGTKNTLWEGGVRGAGLVWSPLLKSAPRVANQMMNIQDWLPTLYVAADETRYIAALRIGDWKFNKGTTYDGNWDRWFGPNGRNGSYDYNLIRKSLVSDALRSIGMPLYSDKKLKQLRKETEIKCAYKNEDDAEKPCHIKNSVCLFNIISDPCEQNNLAFNYPSIVHQMEETLRMYKATEIPPGNKPIDPRANPKYYDYTWTNWMDIINPKSFNEILTEEYVLERNSNFSVPNHESEVQIVLT